MRDKRSCSRNCGEGLCDLLAPQRCAGCDFRLSAPGAGFCGACEPLLEKLPVESGDSCEDRAACAYGGPLADGLQALKYGGDTTRVGALAALLLPHAAPLRGRVDIVTCVPLHARRLRERGFNQAALLAAPLARYLAAQFRPGLLRRVRDVPHQVGASRAARGALARASIISRRPLAGQNVLIVDDVRTTGATLEAARSALFDAGAGRVFTLVVAVAGEHV